MNDGPVYQRTLSQTIKGCRSCGSPHLEVFLDLGSTPLADRLVQVGTESHQELRFPLRTAFCCDCSLVQITETVDPEILFADQYPYYSSVSASLMKHSRENALECIDSRRLGPHSLVVELASNDGYLLRNYVEHGIAVLGIDPAEGPADAARSVGVPTLNDFFTEELARKLAADGRRANVIHANNVLAHVADTNGFVAGIRELIKNDGIAVIEVPYLKNLIEDVEFDTIYHEHLCYFSVTAVDRLFRRHTLFLNEVRQLSIHGGSLRLYFEPVERVGASVVRMMEMERDIGIDKVGYFREFSSEVAKLRRDLRELLTGLKRDGATIAAYGAAAKGATLLNYSGIDSALLDYVVDRSGHKQGKLMPGCLLPILPPDVLVENMPDYVLLLAWNFSDEIMSQQKEYREKGGRFIVPVPSPKIV